MTVFNMRVSFSRLALMGLFVLALMPVQSISVQAQSSDTQALFDRINRLERDIRTLNRQLANMPNVPGVAGQAPMPTPDGSVAPKAKFIESESGVARVMVRVSELEQEVRNATGLAESMAHNIDLANARLDKLVIDLDYRLARLEGRASGSVPTAVNTMPGMPGVASSPTRGGISSVEGSALPTQAAPDYSRPKPAGSTGILGTMDKTKLDNIIGDGDNKATETAAVAPTAQTLEPVPAAPVTQDPAVEAVSIQDQYKAAFNLTRQARYQEAEIAFKAFIKVNGDDPLVGNATYWLGETHYVRKNYMQAAQVFFQAYKAFPKGAKAPDSLLKLGMSMAGMEKPVEACTTFGKLQKEFGENLKSNIKRALDKETLRLQCK
ncbi:MAG: tol-pal system protein YbgF [Rhodospirillaceae bacterium]|nr:MAG: tol-pal system protein YbgF [Rhodospirillaceae bacterium]